MGTPVDLGRTVLVLVTWISTLLGACSLTLANPTFGETDGGTRDATTLDGALLDSGPPPPSPAPQYPWLGLYADVRLNLAWTAVAVADSYDVQLTTGCPPGDRQACPFEPSRTTSEHTTATEWSPGAALALRTTPPRAQVYFWRVRACTGSLCSAWSEVWYFVFGSRTDLDGDGVADVLVGAPQLTSGGGAFVFPAGLSSSPWQVDSLASDPAAATGSSVAALGDVDGDGYSDMILGAPAEDYGGATDPGRAYLVLGGANEPVAAWQSVTIPRAVNFVSFGAWVSAIGDVNGDGYADVAIGAPNMIDDAETNNGGAVFIFYGGPSALTGPTILRSPEPVSSAAFGQSVASADLDHDGYADVVALEPSGRIGTTRRWRGWVFSGGPTGVASTSIELGAGIPDADAGGGFSDVAALPGPEPRLVIAAERASVGGLTNAGRVYVFVASNLISPAWTIDAATPQADERFGASVADAGDVFSDGFRDLVVGVPNARMEVIDLGPDGPTGVRAIVNGFGAVGYASSVCGVGDTNGDEHADVQVGNPMTAQSTVWLGGLSSLMDPPRMSFTGTGRLGTSCASDTP